MKGWIGLLAVSPNEGGQDFLGRFSNKGMSWRMSCSCKTSNPSYNIFFGDWEMLLVFAGFRRRFASVQSPIKGNMTNIIFPCWVVSGSASAQTTWKPIHCDQLEKFDLAFSNLSSVYYSFLLKQCINVKPVDWMSRLQSSCSYADEAKPLGTDKSERV